MVRALMLGTLLTVKLRGRMHHPNADISPMNPLPPVVTLLVLVIAGIEAVLQLGNAGLVGGPEAVGWRIRLMEDYGFFDTIFEWMRANGQMPLEGLWRFVTYVFIHFEAMHAIFACVMLLAIGKFVGERFSPAAFLVIFFGSAVMGALAYGMLLNDQALLIGSYPGIYGLLGAFTWVLYMAYDQVGENRMKAFQLIAILMGMQLLFRLFAGGGNDWVADLFGFGTGFMLSFVAAPDGMDRLRQWLDQTRKR